MPATSTIERRNRALIAFTILTGASDSVIASMKRKHVDLTANCVHQDARQVKTKFSKTFVTYFFPVDDENRRIVADWVSFLKEEQFWRNDDPLFPATRMVQGIGPQFEVARLDRAHWSSASPIRGIFRDAFQRAGLQNFNRTASETHWSGSGERYANLPNISRPGARTLGMKKF